MICYSTYGRILVYTAEQVCCYCFCFNHYVQKVEGCLFSFVFLKQVQSVVQKPAFMIWAIFYSQEKWRSQNLMQSSLQKLFTGYFIQAYLDRQQITWQCWQNSFQLCSFCLLLVWNCEKLFFFSLQMAFVTQAYNGLTKDKLCTQLRFQSFALGQL